MANDFQTIQGMLSQLWYGEPFADIDSDDQTALNLRINMAKDYIAGWPKQRGQGWPFAKTTAYLTTTAKHTTGDVKVTQYSTAIAKSTVSPAFTAAMVERLFILDGGTEPYRIKTVSDADNAVIYTPYQGSTAIDQSYTIVKDIYSLPSDYSYLAKRTLLPSDRTYPGLSYSPDEDFDADHPNSVLIGTPRKYGFADTLSTGISQIWLRFGYPDVAMGIRYKYYKILPDFSDPTDVSAISYVQGGNNALNLACIWQLKEMATEYNVQDRGLAKQEADGAIALMWANAKSQTEDVGEQSSMPPSMGA